MRLTVVGAGLIGRRHIALVRQHPDAQLAAIVDPTTAARDLAAAGATPWYPSLRAMLEGDRPDGVIIATPSALHREHAMQCVEARIPALVEKPLATSVPDAIAIAAASDRSGVPVLVGHHRRHSPILRAARQIIERGVLGRPVAVVGTALLRKPDSYFDEAPWRRSPGGGPILINLIHEIDDLRYLYGEISAVQAQSSSARRGFEVEDTVAMTLAFANGALGTFALSDVAASTASWELTTGEDPAYPQVGGVDCYQIIGDAGSLTVPTMRLTTYVGSPSWQAPVRIEIIAVERRDPLATQLDHFCQVVAGTSRPLVDGWDGAQDLLVAEAVTTAARTGAVVATPSIRPITSPV